MRWSRHAYNRGPGEVIGLLAPLVFIKCSLSGACATTCWKVIFQLISGPFRCFSPPRIQLRTIRSSMPCHGFPRARHKCINRSPSIVLDLDWILLLDSTRSCSCTVHHMPRIHIVPLWTMCRGPHCQTTTPTHIHHIPDSFAPATTKIHNVCTAVGPTRRTRELPSLPLPISS
jgi:hypothetical protein